MATVDGLTKARMLAIEDESITAARLDPVTHHLILTTHGGTDIDVGDVQGAVGPAGPPGAPNPATTVAGPANYGDLPTVGTDLDYARGNHDHGLPAAPPGSLLSLHQYAPPVQDSKDTASTVLVPIDAVNCVTEPFVVPSSGRVLVKVSGCFYTDSGTPMYRCLFDHGTTNQVGFTVCTVYPNPTASFEFPNYEFLIDGLVPGATHQYDLGWAILAGTTGNCNCRGMQGIPVGGTFAPLIVEVWGA